jgi:LmbE family N-acetylglucosaminyl deacetylase
MTTALVIAAHPDDEVLGAGATIASLRHAGVDVHVAIVTDGSSTQYPGRRDLLEAKRNQARLALEALGGGTLHFGDLPDMKLDTVPLVSVNAFLEPIVKRVAPQLVLTHHAQDLNRDHRIVHEATIVCCRPSPTSAIREILAYDVLGVTNFGGTTTSFRPNVFYACEEQLPHKLAALAAYDLEVRPFPHPRSQAALEAQGRVYGALCGRAWAEAFEVVRVVR